MWHLPPPPQGQFEYAGHFAALLPREIRAPGISGGAGQARHPTRKVGFNNAGTLALCPANAHSIPLEDEWLSLIIHFIVVGGTPGGTVVKNPPTNAGNTRDAGSIPGSGGSPGVLNGQPLQYSCLESFVDRGAWWVHGLTESWTRLSTIHTHTHTRSGWKLGFAGISNSPSCSG